MADTGIPVPVRLPSPNIGRGVGGEGRQRITAGVDPRSAPIPPSRILFYLIAIIALAAILRLAWLGTLPAALSHDEAVKGYDAWSILHTGRDQYGARFPLVFRALGDEREALMPYAIVLSESVLGPTDLAVRLPAAIAGIALVGVTFLLGREMFGSRAGLVAAALLAISPWHVQVSRLGFRAGLLPLTTALGLWLFLWALRRGSGMFLAGLALGLGFHTYLAARLFLPLLLVGVATINWQALISTRGGRWWRRPLVPLLAGVALMAAPLALWGAFHPADFAGHAAESAGSGSLPRQAWDALGRYLVYVGPRHLLTQGDPYPVPSTGRFGLLYWPLLPFALLSLVQLVRRHARADLLLLWWLLVYPVPAALTRGSQPDWLRAACGVGVWELIAGLGVVTVFAWLRRRVTPTAVRLAGGSVVVLVLLNMSWFLWDYTQHFPNRAAWAFDDGAATAVRDLAAREDGYARVVLPSQVAAIHDLYLFYSRYNPARLQYERLEDAAPPGAWADVRGFGRHGVCDPSTCCGPGDLCLVRGGWRGAGDVLEEVRDRTGRVAFTIVAGR